LLLSGAMEILRRYIWVIDLIGIMFGAGLAGHAVATLVDGALTASDPSQSCDRCVEEGPIFLPVGAASPALASPVPTLKRIRKIAAHRYEVPRGFVGQFGGIAAPAPLIVPETRDGRRVGVRLFRVERGSLLAALGGDRFRIEYVVAADSTARRGPGPAACTRCCPSRSP
jgi:hypothetical protein